MIKSQHENTDASWDAFFQSHYGQFHWDAGIVSQRPNFQIASIPVFHDASQTVTGIMRINVNNNSLVYNFLDRGVNDLLMQESPNFVTDQINYLFELFDYAFCSADEIPSFPPFDDGVLTEINDCEFVSETLQTWNWIECVVFDGDHATSTRSCGHWEVGSSETTTWIECDESAGGSSSTGGSTSSGGSGNSGTGSSGTGSTSSSTAAQKTAANYLKSTFYGSLNDHISEIMEYGDLSCKNLLIGAKNLLKDQNSSPNSLLAVRCFLWGISIETNPSAPPSCEQENGPLADIFDSAEAANLTGNALDWSRAFGGLGLCDLISSDLNSSQLTNLGLSMDQFLGSIDPYLVGLSSIGINSEPQYPYYDPPPVATIKMDAVRDCNSLLTTYSDLNFSVLEIINLYENPGITARLQEYLSNSNDIDAQSLINTLSQGHELNHFDNQNFADLIDLMADIDEEDSWDANTPRAEYISEIENIRNYLSKRHIDYGTAATYLEDILPFLIDVNEFTNEEIYGIYSLAYDMYSHCTYNTLSSVVKEALAAITPFIEFALLDVGFLLGIEVIGVTAQASYRLLSKIPASVVESTAAIWQRMKNLGPYRANSKIPESFEITSVSAKEFYVEISGTKHLDELVKLRNSASAHPTFPAIKDLRSQLVLDDFGKAVDDIVSNNSTINYLQIYNSGRWEIIFGAPSPLSNGLERIFHAVPKH